MPSGIPKVGVNSGWFKKGIHPKTEFKRGHFSIKKNKTYEEIYGLEKAKEIKNKIKLIKRRRGWKHKEETKKNIGNGNKGKKRSKECIEKNRQWHIGKKVWNDGLTKEIDVRMMKISTHLKNKPLSEGHKKNMSLSRKGKPSSRINFRFSEKSKLKMRNSHLGVPVPEEKKRKMKETWNTPKYRKLARERRANQKNNFTSSIEVKVQNFLKTLSIEYFTHQYRKEINHAYQCDIFIPSLNLVIECDGVYWHHYPTGNDIDKVRTKELLEKGFKVLRLWETDINKMSIKEFQSKLNGVIHANF
jgi:very-short-patch-repair endonuclease